MKNLARWSFRLRLLLLIGLILVPATGLMVFTSIEQRRQAAEGAEKRAFDLIRPASSEYERLIEGVRQFLMVMSRLPEVRGRDEPKCRALFARLGSDTPLYANLGVIQPDGSVFCSALPVPPGVNLSDRSYFRRALQTRRFATGDYQIGRITGKASINFGYPVFDDAGQVQGVVFAALDLSWLNRLATEADLPPGSTLTLVDRQGTVLVRYPDPERWVGRQIAATSLGRTILGQESGVVQAVDADSVNRLHVFAPLRDERHGTRAYLSVGIPAAAAFADANATLARNLSILAFVGLLTILLAWVGGEWLVLRRVNVLLRATQRVSTGDLRARTGLQHGQDELGQLARAFDEMCVSLERLRLQNELILAAAGEGIVGLDRDDNITFVNPAAAKTVGWEAAELIGRPLHETLHHTRPDGSPYPRSECPIFAAFQDGAVHRETDEVFWRKDGTSFPVEYVSTPLRENGALAGAVVVFKDVTERKNAESELAEAHRQVLEAEQEKEQFHRQVIRAVTQDKFRLMDAEEISTEGEQVLEMPLNVMEDYPALRDRLREVALNAGMARNDANDFVLAVGEAATNAVKHGTEGRCVVRLTGERIVARVTDCGAGIRPENLVNTIFQSGFSTKVSLGMGYTLMLELVDQVWLATGPNGTLVQVEKWLHPEEHPAPINLGAWTES